MPPGTMESSTTKGNQMYNLFNNIITKIAWITVSLVLWIVLFPMLCWVEMKVGYQKVRQDVGIDLGPEVVPMDIVVTGVYFAAIRIIATTQFLKGTTLTNQKREILENLKVAKGLAAQRLQDIGVAV